MENDKKRLLCIMGIMNAGGAETFLMRIYRALDKKKYQMDFLVTSKEIGFYDKEIQSMGGKIFHSVPKSKNPIKSFFNIKKTVKDEQYKKVLRISHYSLSTLDLLAAKFGGAKKLIYRSSNSNISGGPLKRILNMIFGFLPKLIPTIKIAPSTEAAEFVFGKKSIKKGNVSIIKNAIELDNFIFNQNIRLNIRKQFNIDDKLIIGHIGRFSYQKNHAFLIDIFYEISKTHPDCVLMLVGNGELEKDIKHKINNYGLDEKVIFAGIRSDIAHILMAMDVLIFPSFFEGMPNVVIEAQATGLPCLISDKITKEANITGLVNYLSIKDNPSIWANKAISLAKNTDRNINYKKSFQKNGYDINLEIEKFIKLIFE